MKRGKPMRRGEPPKRRKGLSRKKPLQTRKRLQNHGRRKAHKGSGRVGTPKKRESHTRAKRRRPAVGTELTTFALERGCEVAAYRSDPCWGPLDPHHVRARGMGRARGDWVRLVDGRIVGNVVGACRGHHEWCEDHPAESRPLLIPVAEWIGDRAQDAGIQPRLHERRP